MYLRLLRNGMQCFGVGDLWRKSLTPPTSYFICGHVYSTVVIQNKSRITQALWRRWNGCVNTFWCRQKNKYIVSQPLCQLCWTLVVWGQGCPGNTYGEVLHSLNPLVFYLNFFYWKGKISRRIIKMLKSTMYRRSNSCSRQESFQISLLRPLTKTSHFRGSHIHRVGCFFKACLMFWLFFYNRLITADRLISYLWFCFPSMLIQVGQWPFYFLFYLLVPIKVE